MEGMNEVIVSIMNSVGMIVGYTLAGFGIGIGILGSKIADKKFYQQFEGKNPNNFVLKVKNDGGNIDAITAATISSRAYCDAVNKAYNTIKSMIGGENNE